MRLRKWFREPLVHFLALGVLLFVVFQLVSRPDENQPDQIVITAGEIENLATVWQKTWQRPPTEQELIGLVQERIKEEVLYREALAMGLDRDDTIIRRRLRQKMEFLFDDWAPTDPTVEELQTFLEENPDAFRQPARLTFTQIFLSPDERGDRVIEDADQLLVSLRAHEPPVDTESMGDRILLPSDVEDMPTDEIDRLFGKGFATALLGLELEIWTGPVESGYGLHLVNIRGRIDSRLPELDEIRDTVTREWQAMQRRQANEAFYQGLRERYTVVIDEPEPPQDERMQTAKGAP